ncbi:beta-1 3-glucan-binding protein [Biomphalaria pfeifferi]|uniref:Beta-1 3-glucan-binding protein n=1 Tax=Biomphalaria pfeifferi TaxID=112525 RepID=A0AAD8F066_BIOPF|nr:beta-1 3-glucan-binding protein [Biomphalaria pfeifferi]
MKMKVLFWTLVYLGVVLSGQVNIEYNKPVLKFTLPCTSDYWRILKSDGSGFMAFAPPPKVWIRLYLRTEGWQYQTSDVSLDGADEVSAYALIYDTKESLKEVTDTSTLKEVTDTSTLKEVTDTSTLKEVTDTSTLKEVTDTSTLKEVTDTSTLKEVTDTSTLKEVTDTSTLKEVTDTSTLKEVTDTSTLKEVTDTSTLKEVTDTSTLKEVTDTSTLKEVTDTSTLKEVTDTSTLKEVTDTSTLKEVTDTSTLKEVTDTSTLKEVTDTSTLKEVTDTSTLKEVTDTSTLKGEEKNLINTNQRNSHQGALQISSPRRIRAVPFKDDFTRFNIDNWRFEVSMYGGSHGQFQVFTNDPKNVYTRDGYLYIKPIQTVSDPRFDEHFLHTGHKDMYGNTAHTYINVDKVRARILKGDWIWLGIWMVPKDSIYGGWPRSGEIDIMESKGNSGVNFSEKITSHLIWGTSWQPQYLRNYHGERMFVDNQQILTAVPPPGGLFEQGKFTGTNLWSSGSKMMPFDQDFLLVLGIAIGGTDGYFPDGNHYGNVTKPWHNNYSPHPMLDFWNAKNSWLPIWHGETAALVVDYVEFKSL